jgi:hypothetical protein
MLCNYSTLHACTAHKQNMPCFLQQSTTVLTHHLYMLRCTVIVHLHCRGRASVGSLLFFTVGEFLLVALAVSLPAWGHLAIAAGAINVATLLLFPFIPESARWLLSQGKQQQAAELLQAIATANGSRMPEQPLVCSKESENNKSSRDDVHGSCSSSEAGTSSSNNQALGSPLGLMALLRSRSLLVRSVVLLITWYSLMQVRMRCKAAPCCQVSCLVCSCGCCVGYVLL